MGKFVRQCDFKLGRPGHFITTSSFIYVSDIAGPIEIPAGFVTDFASIPNLVPRWLFDPMRHGRLSALPHDYLCRRASSYEERTEADMVFYEAMGDEGVRQWRRVTMYYAVRIASLKMKLVGKWK